MGAQVCIGFPAVVTLIGATLRSLWHRWRQRLRRRETVPMLAHEEPFLLTSPASQPTQIYMPLLFVNLARRHGIQIFGEGFPDGGDGRTSDSNDGHQSARSCHAGFGVVVVGQRRRGNRIASLSNVFATLDWPFLSCLGVFVGFRESFTFRSGLGLAGLHLHVHKYLDVSCCVAGSLLHCHTLTTTLELESRHDAACCDLAA